MKTYTIGLSALVASALLAQAAQAACEAPRTGTGNVPVFSPPLAKVVTGAGRLQFYSAPDSRCAMKGVFVVTNDQLIAYAETRNGWTSVMYLNPRTGNDVSGWVKSARLKTAGTVGPRRQRP